MNNYNTKTLIKYIYDNITNIKPDMLVDEFGISKTMAYSLINYVVKNIDKINIEFESENIAAGVREIIA